MGAPRIRAAPVGSSRRPRLTLMPPYHVGTPEDYGLWLEQLIAAHGGYLDPGPYLAVEIAVDSQGDSIGVIVPQQRVRFYDDTFLEFDIVVDDISAQGDLPELEPVGYSFHYQVIDGPMIWRKDLHEGHFDELGTDAHVHDNAKDEDDREAFEVIDLDEVLEQVSEYQSGRGLSTE
jgi:hypothetical protein